MAFSKVARIRSCWMRCASLSKVGGGSLRVSTTVITCQPKSDSTGILV